MLLAAVFTAAVAKAQTTSVSATVDAAANSTPVPRGFAGFSIEYTRLTSWAGVFDASAPVQFNSSLVNLLNQLGALEGPPFVRVGGNSQDQTWFKASSKSSPPPFGYATAPALNAVTPTDLQAIGWIQRATGAPFSFGLNLAGNNANAALDLVTAVQAAFDPSGVAVFDIGNESDLFGSNGYRDPSWSPSAYQVNLAAFITQLRTAQPNLTLSAPAYATTRWVPPTNAAAFSSLLDVVGSRVAFVTIHRYTADGKNPPANPASVLLQPSNSSAVASNFIPMLVAARARGLPLRINETNSFYNGGLPGVSDSLAAALWVADVLGSYAQAGMAGVNFHGGAGGPYSPVMITRSANGAFVTQANPVFYGMFAFADFIQNGAGLIPAAAQPSNPSVSLYASKDAAGSLRVLLINKSDTTPLTCTLKFQNLAGLFRSAASLRILHGPNSAVAPLAATSGLSYGGRSFDSTGNLAGTDGALSVPSSDGATFAVNLPVASIGVFTLDPNGPALPVVAVSPTAASCISGSPVTFTATATGSAPFSYQWLRDGQLIPGATASRFLLPLALGGDAGAYAVIVTNPAGSVTSRAANFTVTPADSRLVNLSARVAASPANIPIVGFVIGGSAPHAVLLRGVGPTLTVFGLNGVLPNPQLTLFQGQTPIQRNVRWTSAPNVADIRAAVAFSGAFSIPETSSDSAILTTLTPGNFTAMVNDAGGATGLVLCEIYTADTQSRLLNLSARAVAGTGSNILIAGFVVQGNSPRPVLVRAIGPTLAAFGVTGVLSNPQLQVLDATAAVVARNTGWESDGNAARLSQVQARVGAFALASGARDCAVLTTLAPGSYTALVSGGIGAAMIEVYDVP